MLEKQFRFQIEHEALAKQTPYNLILKQDATWKNSKRRLLVVFQTVDGRDLKAGELLGDRATFTAFKNAYKYARQTARPYTEDGYVPEFALTVANFNEFGHLHLRSPAKRKEAEAIFAERIHKLIRKIQPTHILFSGDEAIHSCYPNLKYPQYKRGWVHKMKYQADGQTHPVKVTSTVDFARLLEQQGLYANLLGFWTRHLAYLMLGRNPHDLGGLELKPKYVKTIKEFDQMMLRFDSASEAALDTETKNLSSLHNKLYTIQFAFDKDPNTGYILAVDHPRAHWTAEERKYIKRELRQRLGAKTGPTLVTFNGHMFDLRVLRQVLRIPIMWLRVWEISFGEHELDENRSLLNDTVNMMDDSKATKSKSSYGGLAPLLCSYGNDHYYTAKFGKSERDSIGSIDIANNPDSQEYCLPPGQEVLTPEGRVPVESLRPGDKVMSFNHTTGKAEPKKVLATLNHKNRKRLVRISYGDSSMVVTEDHPVWSVDRNEYVPAGSIRKGERLIVK